MSTIETSLLRGATRLPMPRGRTPRVDFAGGQASHDTQTPTAPGFFLPARPSRHATQSEPAGGNHRRVGHLLDVTRAPIAGAAHLSAFATTDDRRPRVAGKAANALHGWALKSRAALPPGPRSPATTPLFKPTRPTLDPPGDAK